MSLHLFISHVSESKQLASQIAKSLGLHNIEAFVAHEDIQPTAEWQLEIEAFLDKMDCRLCLLNTGYSSSVWCNQEIGVCFGKSIPLISLRMEEDPKGFIGKWQAYTPGQPFDMDVEVWKILNLIYNKAKESDSIRAWVIQNLHTSGSFAESNELLDTLENIELNEAEINSIQEAFQKNTQVKGSNSITKVLNKQWLSNELGWKVE